MLCFTDAESALLLLAQQDRTVDIERAGEATPFGVGEAQHTVNRYRPETKTLGELLHGVGLPSQVVDEVRAIPVGDEEPSIVVRPATDIAPLDAPRVVVGVDDPHARRDHHEVIDDVLRPGNDAIVEDDTEVDEFTFDLLGEVPGGIVQTPVHLDRSTQSRQSHVAYIGPPSCGLKLS